MSNDNTNITLTVTSSDAPDPIPTGFYPAKLTDIEERSGEHGAYLLLTFQITEGEQEGVERTTIASKKLSTGSKLYGYVEALLGSKPEKKQSIDISSLISKQCRILVKDKLGDADGWQVISEVLPAE